MRDPRIRAAVRLRSDSIPGGRRLHTWNDLLGVFKGLYGVKTGHTGTAGWCEVAAVRRNGVTLYTTVLGSPTRSQRNTDLASLLAWGISRYRSVWIVPRGHVYLQAECRLREALRPDRRRTAGRAGGARRQAARRAHRRSDGARAAGRTWPARRRSPHLLGTAARGPTAADRRSLRGQARLGGRAGFYAGRTLTHVKDWFS